MNARIQGLDILMRFNKTRYRFFRLSGVRMRSIL